MRIAFLTTVAAAALSLSVAAIAQTSGGSGGSTGGTSGGASGGVSGGSSGSAPVIAPGGTGGTSGTGSGGTSGGTSGGMSGNAAGGTTGSTSGGAASGTTSGTTGGTAGNASGTANTTGSTTSSTNINVTSEQRTEITRAFSSVDVRPMNDVNFTVNVGTVVPDTVVTHLQACPSEVVRILQGLPECRYVVVRDQVVIIEPKTRRIVTVIERRG